MRARLTPNANALTRDILGFKHGDGDVRVKHVRRTAGGRLGQKQLTAVALDEFQANISDVLHSVHRQQSSGALPRLTKRLFADNKWPDGCQSVSVNVFKGTAI